MGPPMWPWRCGLMARPVSGVEWSGLQMLPSSESKNRYIFVIISASLHTAKRYWYGTFVPTICWSAHVNCGETADWIGIPFRVVSWVGLGMGVVDFDGDRRRRRGSLGVK